MKMLDYKPGLSALDIGAGRNVDYYRYLKDKFSTFIGYEPDT